MVTRPGANTDIQVARFANLESLEQNWLGIPIEIGARGGVVQIWGINHYVGNVGTFSNAAAIWASALSSNPDHEGHLALGLDEYIGGAALYGTMMRPARMVTLGAAGLGYFTWPSTYTPLYGIIRPRRQIWVLYLVNVPGTDRQGIEIYYSEMDASLRQEANVNAKYGKYRRGR